ncbi:MAG: hypothetical protein WA398_00065 [Nitrososphaeraceae archaeon]
MKRKGSKPQKEQERKKKSYARLSFYTFLLLVSYPVRTPKQAEAFKEEIARLDKEAKASSSLLLLLTWALS